MTEFERTELARNIRHRLADMLGSQWSGALDAAMDEMLLDEFDKYFDREVDVTDACAKIRLDADEQAVHDEPNDGSIAWPLRKRDAGDGDAYLKGIMEKD